MSPARFLRPALLEYLEYDSMLFRWLVATGGTAAASVLWASPDKKRSFNLLSRVHRAGGSDLATAAIQRSLAWANRLERRGQATGLWHFYDAHVRGSIELPQAKGIVKNPKALLGYRVLVLKSASEDERGVIAIDYSYIFPLFAALFDVRAIAERYHIVLEPSWRGLCTADILAYSQFDFPVFVEAIEPRDVTFIESLQSNLVTVPVAANWWVDHRLVTPVSAVERDIDVVMVAAWSAVKRHWRFFQVLSELRRRGHALRVALVGYPADKRREDIEADARAHGVLDQVEWHERLPLPKVGRLLARSKAHVLWSRKEGANRAIVEALFADVPIVVREGLSYGYSYPYINPATGHFATEKTLGDRLLEMTQRTNSYHPREWAMANMSCQRATAILEERIRAVALARGEPWTRGLAVKTVQLETQRYWNPDDRTRFEADYAYLEANIRTNAAR